MPRLTLDTIVCRREDIPTGKIDAELMALDPKAGQVYGMDAIGTIIWDAIARPTAIECVVDQLLADYDVPLDRCRSETLAFVQTLADADLLIVQDR